MSGILLYHCVPSTRSPDVTCFSKVAQSMGCQILTGSPTALPLVVLHLLPYHSPWEHQVDKLGQYTVGALIIISLLSSLKVKQTSYNPAPSPSTALAPSSKSKISSDPSAALPHLTTPLASTPNPPAVCHRLPLSVGRFQIPSSLPNFQTA